MCGVGGAVGESGIPAASMPNNAIGMDVRSVSKPSSAPKDKDNGQRDHTGDILTTRLQNVRTYVAGQCRATNCIISSFVT